MNGPIADYKYPSSGLRVDTGLFSAWCSDVAGRSYDSVTAATCRCRRVAGVYWRRLAYGGRHVRRL